MTMTLSVFPYSFVRYTAIHQHELRVFNLSEPLQRQLSRLRELEVEKEKSKTLLCDQLYIQIQEEQDDNYRRQLINHKRAAFNDKIIEECTDHTAVSIHMRLLHTLQEARQQWEEAFNTEQVRHRTILKEYAQHELLCKGLLLSSPTLYDQLSSFISRDADSFRHKELKTAYSLLRYLTRMSFKTSPFSTFTHTGVAIATEEQQPQIIALRNEIRCGIRLNNKLFDYLKLLMVHHPQLNEILEIRLNTTVQQKGGHLQFLASYRNIESFQKMPVSSLATWLCDFLATQDAPVNLGELTDTLSTYVPDADRAQIKAYLLQLAANGFIETGIGCSGISPDWDEVLTSYLSAHLQSQPAVKPLHDLLIFLQQQKLSYAAAPAKVRGQLLKNTGQALNALLTRLQEEAGLTGITATADNLAQQVREEARAQKEAFNVTRFMLQQFPSSGIFYEDTFTTALSNYPAAAVDVLATKADRLCTLLESLDTMQAERIRMRDFFLQHFRQEEQVSVTHFYHSYYQQEKKELKETLRQRNATQEDAITAQLRQLLQIKQLSTSDDTVDLSATHFEASSTDSIAARGMFVQLYQQEDEWYGVINHLLPGMGKVAGRFLDLFDGAITESFREWNNRLYPACMQLELSDGSSFNANVHPPLLPHGIRIPGGHSNYTEQQLIPLEKVAVKYNSDTNLLSLIHVPDGREIFAYDLSLQSFFNRSNFYQLLAHFNPERRVPLRKLISITDEKHAAAFSIGDADIIAKPRITFEKHIILRRKAWVIKTKTIPQQENTETDAAYYLRITKWQQQSGLPEHAFLFLKSYAIPAAREDKLKMMKDDYKPQYICFAQPVMVNLFKKLLGKAGQHIYVEEMLPHVSHLQETTPVTEHLIHWYKY